MKIKGRKEIKGGPVLQMTLESLIVDAAAAVRPPERLTVSEAAEKYRKINVPGSYVGDWLNATTPYLVEPMDVLQSLDFNAMVFVGPAQSGKSLALDTPIATPDGWKAMGDLVVGDHVFGVDGKPVQVVIANPIQYGRPCYRITFDEGGEIVADAEHRWSVSDCNRPGERTVTTEEMVQTGVSTGTRARFRVRVAAALETQQADLLLDPYVLGVWLGDGSELYGYVSVGQEDAEAMSNELAARGYRATVYKPSALHRCFALGVRGPDGVFIDQYLSTMGLGGGAGKQIPEEYLRASESQRRELLRGLCDTDGCLMGRYGRAVQFCSVDENLAQQVAELARSLGLKVRVRFKNGPGRGSWNVLFTIYSGEDAFSLPRKVGSVRKDAPKREGETSARFIRSIEPVPSVPVRCIGVDAEDHLFLAGRSMVPTHNTDMVLNWLGYSAKCDPADMMIVEKSNTDARDFSIRRIDRLHRWSPEFGAMLGGGRHGDNTFDKHYNSGMLLTMGWPSINVLSGKPIPRLWLTDYDRMDEDVDGEGDPFLLAQKRGTTFGRFAMCAVESSPGKPPTNTKKWVRKTPHEAPPTTGVLGHYNNGDRRRWYWDCIFCHEKFEPNFNLLQYPDCEDALEAAEQAVMVCPHCQGQFTHDPGDGQPGKHVLNQQGRWVKDGMFWTKEGLLVGTPRRSKTASFWLKGVAAAFSNWTALVQKYIDAEREYERTQSEQALKTTVNTDQGDLYIPKSTINDRVPEDIKATARNYGLKTVPPAVRFLIASIDVQKNRFVVQVHGVALNGDIYVIDRFDIKKSKRPDEVAEGFSWVNPGAYLEDWKLIAEQVIQASYPLGDGSGRHMGIKLTLCDSAGRKGFTANAYKFFRWLRKGDAPMVDPDEDEDRDEETSAEIGEYKWVPGMAGKFLLLKGASSREAPRVQIAYPDSQRKDRNAGARGEVPVLMVNTQQTKDMVNHRLDRTAPGGRFCFPDWLDDNFYIELTVEVNDPKKGWYNPHDYRNESWDLLSYCMAATLTPMIGLDLLNAQKPPSWAEEWDHNDLVFNPRTQAQAMEPKRKRASLKELGSNLA